ncbi:MAG: DUF4320 family protein [Oscillospiraceae bacterium]|nr:DUF4320 family protein [Oscillospiraceae bacterium]
MFILIARILRQKRGEGFIDVVVLVLCSMMVIALAVRILPIFVEKNQLDTFATELIREIEISGRVGVETTIRAGELSDRLGINPTITWSATGNIQLNQEVTVTLTLQRNLGLFGGFGSFPVTLTSRASGKGGVYWK